MKYVCATSYYPDCPGHSQSYFEDLFFANSLKYMINYMIDHKDNYEFHPVYRTNSHLVMEIEQEISGHHVIGLTFMIHTRSSIKIYKTIDNGKGQLILSRVR